MSVASAASALRFCTVNTVRLSGAAETYGVTVMHMARAESGSPGVTSVVSPTTRYSAQHTRVLLCGMVTLSDRF